MAVTVRFHNGLVGTFDAGKWTVPDWAALEDFLNYTVPTPDGYRYDPDPDLTAVQAGIRAWGDGEIIHADSLGLPGLLALRHAGRW